MRFVLCLNEEKDEHYTDAKGVRRCRKCDLLVVEEPLTCAACLGKKKKNGRDNPGDGCLKARCQGHDLCT